MKFKLFSLILPIAVLASCEKTSLGEADSGPELGDVRLEVSLPALVKAGLEGDGCVWEAGDSISVWDGYAERVFHIVNAGSDKAEFTGKAAEADKYYVAYPAGICHSYADGKVNVRVSGVQQARKSSLSKASYACFGISEGGKVGLKPAASVVKVELKPGNKAVSGIVLRATGAESLSGYLVVTSWPEDVRPVYVGSSNEVRLVPDEGENFIAPGTYYVTVTPTALKGGLDVIFDNGFYAPVTLHSDAVGESLEAGLLASCGAFDPVGSLLPSDAEDTSSDPASTQGLDFGVLPIQRHPRIIADAEDFVLIRKFASDKANAASPLAVLHSEAVAYADALCGKHDPVAPGDAAEAAARLMNCAYAYAVTRESKYLANARENLSAVCSMPDWCPSDYAVSGEFQMAVAAAYDWLYYDLTDSERAAALEALTQLGIGARPSEAVAGSAGQICNAGLVFSALAVYEKNKALASAAADWAVGACKGTLDDLYGNDGAYPEGYETWNNATSCQVAMTQALLSVFGGAAGIESHSGFGKTADFMLYMSDGVGPFPYADGGIQNVSALPAMWWFAARQGRPDLVFGEMSLLNGKAYRSCSPFLAMTALYLMKYPGTGFDSPSAPSKTMWSGNSAAPMVIVRNGWKGDETDVYLAAKGGKAGVPGAHMDAGSFIFDSEGIRWIDEILPDDIKSYREKIAAAGKDFLSVGQDSWRWDVFAVNNLSHSTLSFANPVSGRLHDTDHSVGGKATLVSTIDNGTEQGGVFDLSPVFEGQVESVKRTVVLKNGKDAVVTDEVKAGSSDAVLMWAAPTSASVNVDDDCIELVYGKSEMYLTVTSTDNAVVPVLCDYPVSRPAGMWGWIERDWDQKVLFRSIMGYKATVPAGRSVTFVTTISRTAPGQSTGGAGNERPEM